MGGLEPPTSRLSGSCLVVVETIFAATVRFYYRLVATSFSRLHGVGTLSGHFYLHHPTALNYFQLNEGPKLLRRIFPQSLKLDDINDLEFTIGCIGKQDEIVTIT